MTFDSEYIRNQFPALQRIVNGNQVIYFDGPGGTQMPRRVIDVMVDYLANHNSNTGGVFAASSETDEIILKAKNAFADFFGCSWDEVSFSDNSTTINMKLSQAIARDLKPGDKILITALDHDANRSPWVLLRERGIDVESVNVDTETLTLDMEDFRRKLTANTKVVAFNYASNAVGTISDAKQIVALARDAGAISVVDAVHFALHGVIDVAAIGVDYLFCSAYKFFGPHLGVLYGRSEAMDRLRPLKVSAQSDNRSHKFETGTLNHEGIAGAAEAIEFIADIGAHHLAGTTSGALPRRHRIVEGMNAMEEFEQPLAEYLKNGLQEIRGLKLFVPPHNHPCTSTISFRLENVPPQLIARRLADKGIFVWAGSFYAVELVRALGLSDRGGLLRIGLAPYNTRKEVDRCLSEIREIADAPGA
jgi:cysteine desulfurase family protein (TIGR01976 family)